MIGTGAPDGELGQRAAALAALARRELGTLSPPAHERGLAAVRARMLLRRRWAWSFGFAGLTAAAATAAALLLVRSNAAPPVAAAPPAEPEGPPLALHVDGAALAADGAIQAAPGGKPALRFGDGTVIAFEPGSKGRLASVDGRGAHVAIADGSAAVDVVPRPRARWTVDAGPFTIHVHGTVFTAAWNAADGRLDVRLVRGAISVDGPLATGAISMHGGQRLTVALHESRVLLRPIGDDEAPAARSADVAPVVPVTAARHVASAPAARHAISMSATRHPVPAPATAPMVATRAPAEAPAEEMPPPPPAARPAERTSRPARSWTVALAAGDFAAIIDEAEQDLPRVLHSASSEDLAAVADAARYQRRDELARRALEAQRQRFHGSPRAADAAFFLGRLDENADGGLVRALHWYDRYLDEAPTGSYAAEALGRRMVALRELYGAGVARPVAEAYVRRFPRGSYAGAAHVLLGEPNHAP
ncbi:MAG TPA: FecR domain-containing protein [Polyangia bacterium]|nr:FecR domain-containing protein [Polyangia bacterium]